jgi:hypothetical protein
MTNTGGPRGAPRIYGEQANACAEGEKSYDEAHDRDT